MPANYCRCWPCRQKRRKGLILGSRLTYTGGQSGMHHVSDYVPYHRFLKGRRRKQKPEILTSEAP